jgi:hypothetical protein
MDPDPRPRPTSTVAAAGQAASDVVAGLQKNPMLLALVVLNIIGIGAGVWVLKGLTDISNRRFAEMMTITKECFEHVKAH